MTDIRKFMDLVEYGPKIGTTDSAVTYRDLDGRAMNSNISYNITPGKVVAQLSSYNSQIYTKLAQKINRIDALEKRIKQLKEEVKQEGRDHVSDLFAADDAASTRVVETLQFIFTLSKDPKPTTTYKYAEILKELEGHLTPELISVLETIKAKFESTVQKAPSLKVTKKTEESLEEGIGDKLAQFFAKFKATIMGWAKKFDSKLDALKAQAAAVTETFQYEEGHQSTGLLRDLVNERTAPEVNTDFGNDPKAKTMMVFDYPSAIVQDGHGDYRIVMKHPKYGNIVNAVPYSSQEDAENIVKQMAEKPVTQLINWNYIKSLGGKMVMVRGFGGQNGATSGGGMAFKTGQTLYCGSRSGKLLGRSRTNPNTFIVELPNGERDAFPADKCSTEKPGMFKKAASWVVGEDEEFGAEAQGLTEAPKCKYSATIPTWIPMPEDDEAEWDEERDVNVDASIASDGTVDINHVYDAVTGEEVTRILDNRVLDYIADKVMDQYEADSQQARDDAAWDRFMDAKLGF